MNQNSIVVNLRRFTDSERPFGNIQGKAVFQRLKEAVETAGAKIVGVSLEDIEATDASFPRESVVSLAKQLRGEVGIYLVGLHDRDLIDNWAYAARAKDQPLVIWDHSNFEVIGPEQTPATKQLIDYVLERGSVLASQAAADLELSVQNASTRLKNLVKDGYLMRVEEAASTGGIEFQYRAIKGTD